jgi:hypothetical protein
MNILVVSRSLQTTCKIHAVYPLLEMEKRSKNFSWRFRKVEDADLSEISWADILWFVRDCDSHAQNLAQWAKILGKRVIYDLDDNLALLPISTEIGMQALAADIRTSISQMTMLADNVGVTSIVLMEDMAHLKHITLRPQYQDLSQEHFENTFNRLQKSDIESPKFRGEVTVVSPTLRPLNQEFISRILRNLVSSHKGIRINFVTFSESQLIDQDVMTSVRLTKLRSINNYKKYIRFLGAIEDAVGLAYLDNSRFNMSKTQAKYRDFASAGIPGVYSNIPPYSSSIEQNQTGLLVENDPDEWSKSIFELVSNKLLASNISKKALNDIKVNYSFDKYLEHIEEIFSDLYTTIDHTPKMRSWNKKITPSLRLVSLPGDTEVYDYLNTVANLNPGLVIHDIAVGSDDRINSVVVINCADKEQSYLAKLDLQFLQAHLHDCNCSFESNLSRFGSELYSLSSMSQLLIEAASKIHLSPTAGTKKSQKWRISKFMGKVKNSRAIILNRIEIFRLIHRN